MTNNIEMPRKGQAFDAWGLVNLLASMYKKSNVELKSDRQYLAEAKARIAKLGGNTVARTKTKGRYGGSKTKTGTVVLKGKMIAGSGKETLFHKKNPKKLAYKIMSSLSAVNTYVRNASSRINASDGRQSAVSYTLCDYAELQEIIASLPIALPGPSATNRQVFFRKCILRVDIFQCYEWYNLCSCI